MRGSVAERLVAILQRERRASAQNLRDVHALSIEERVVAGEAMRGLEVIERGASSRVRLRCGENLSRFRDGDTLWLGSGERIEEGLAVLFREHDPVEGTVTVELDRYQPPGTLDRDTGLVLDRREIDLTDRVTDAVRAVFRSGPAGGASWARDAIEGAPSAIRAAEPMGGAADAAEAGLDPSQTKAFVAACSRSCCLVQGPPGSGKTRLSAAVVRAFVRRGKSVLVAAFTHRAVNNLLNAIARLDPAVPLAKIGSARNADGLDPTVARIGTARGLRSGQQGVVGATTHAASGLLGRSFDLVLVDEAGQVSLAQACSVLPLARRHLFVGDHRQLPPLVVAEHRDPLARRSIFEHLHEAYGSHLLRTTYRMNAELCAFPSRAFYDGLLVPAEANAARRLELAGDPGPLLAPDPPLVLVPLSHRGARTLAPSEADLAADLVARAIACGLPPSEVAVIAPHRAQGGRIRAKLRERLRHLDRADLPLVDTVERLQGGERDLIVLSFTASDPEAVLGEAAFLFSPNRLNVSLTRARKKLVVLASDALLDVYPDDPVALRGADLLRQLFAERGQLARMDASFEARR